MRTGARVSPSWPGGELLEAGYVEADWISRQSRQTPLQTGRAIRFLNVTPILRKKRLIIEVSALTPRSAERRSQRA